MNDEPFNPFASEEVSPPFAPHWEARRRIAQAIRDLTEMVVTTDPSIEDMNEIAAALDAQTERLAATPRLYGRLAFEEDGKHGGLPEVSHELNAVGGWSNPLSPGMNIWIDGNRVHSKVTCNWAYEGPPEHVHGGFVAAIFDQFMGMAQIVAGQRGMTGRLTVRYHRPTPLNQELRLEAWEVKTEGRKTEMAAEMRVDGEVTATCEALFIAPRGGLNSIRQN
jgi:hypothetical protein